MIQRVSDKTAEKMICEERRVIAMWFFSHESIACDHGREEIIAFEKDFKDIVKCVALDVDENPTLTEEMLVDAVPTLILIKDADEIARFEGPYSREMLGQRFKEIIKRYA